MNEQKIVIDVNIGDTILTGRFRNKKTKVKTISKDEQGIPTINGKRILTFKMFTETYSGK